MPKFSVEFDIENAAFAEGNAGAETARILRRIAERLEDGEDSGACVDINGNQVGWWSIELPEEE